VTFNDQGIPTIFKKSVFSVKIFLSFLKLTLTIRACFVTICPLRRQTLPGRETIGDPAYGGFFFE
jgi:hypothetical protein